MGGDIITVFIEIKMGGDIITVFIERKMGGDIITVFKCLELSSLFSCYISFFQCRKGKK